MSIKHYARLDSKGDIVVFSVSWEPKDPELILVENLDIVRNPGKYTIEKGKIKAKPKKGVTP